jgi:HSP20 family molecular chaperone IbpA
VPKAAPITIAVKVESAPLPELSEPRAQVALALPGLGAGDVSASITRERALLLHVRGASPAFGSLHEVLRLPERAAAEQARAAMVNGVFTFSVPIEPEHTTPVCILAAPPADGAATNADGNAAKAREAPLLLLEAAVPGLAAGDFAGEVRGRALTLTSAKPSALGGRVRRTVLLPPHTQPREVVVTCVNGLLRATAPRAALPARAPVPVSDTQRATLKPAPPATPTATVATVAAPADAPAPMEEAPENGAAADAPADAQ